MNQQQFIQKFNSNPNYVHQLDPALFKRSDVEIYRYVEMLYLSIQKEMGVNAYYTIRINKHFIIN